jgi:hypothetical protein
MSKETELELRVAQALAKRLGAPWERLDRANRDDYLSQARVAIEAMEDPIEQRVADAETLVREDAAL